MPNAATEKLLKILKLEAQTGYQDKAVTRGLSAFVSAWLADAERANIDPDWAQAIAQEMREVQRLRRPLPPPCDAGRHRRAAACACAARSARGNCTAGET